jgi:hypothetical protein
MFIVKSKNQFGEEILVNPEKIAYAVPSSGGKETVIFFDNDTHISVLESFVDFKKRYAKPTVKLSVEKDVVFTEELVNAANAYPEHLPRLPTGNVDKRTNQYKEWIASKEAA